MDALYARMRAEVKAVRDYLKQGGEDDGSDDGDAPQPGGSLGERADKLDELIGATVLVNQRAVRVPVEPS